MVYDGHVENGVIVVHGPVALPDGANVRVEILAGSEEKSAAETLPSLYEQLAPLVGSAKGLPSDLARNHDHYLHGRPKA